MQHSLKINLVYYNELLNGNKTAELRFNDRNFKIKDIIHFHEYETEQFYTGSKCLTFEITHILTDFEGLKQGFCVLSIKRIK